VRAALIGTGTIGREHLAGLSELADVEIAAVCDRSPAAAEATAERFGASDWFTDHTSMLRDVSPDVVHVTTPVGAHLELSIDALDAGANVIVEKPATVDYEQLRSLLDHAERRERFVVEDYNYLFDEPIEQLLQAISTGELGEITDADIAVRQEIFAERSAFLHPDPATVAAGGGIGDFLPHLASLAHAIVGPHRRLRTMWGSGGSAPGQSDEFRALVEAERGTATLSFSARAHPNGCWVRVSGTRLSATARVGGRRLSIERAPSWREPLKAARESLAAGVSVTSEAFRHPWDKLSGKSPYLNIHRLIARTYGALREGGPLPVSMPQVHAVNRMRADLLNEDNRV
jgi:predicted dehydrogenase